jgi:hypothetical protein
LLDKVELLVAGRGSESIPRNRRLDFLVGFSGFRKIWDITFLAKNGVCLVIAIVKKIPGSADHSLVGVNIYQCFHAIPPNHHT